MHIVGGLFKGRILKVPKGETVRPTSGRLREAVFNICQGDIEEAVFLDLFAGSGAVGLEALSRGAASAIFIENSKEAYRCLQQNIESLGVQEKAKTLFGDVFIWLDRLSRQRQQFTHIFADPPYDRPSNQEEQSSLGRKVLEYLDTHALLVQKGQFFLEEAESALKHLPSLQQLCLKSDRQLGRSVLHQYVKL